MVLYLTDVACMLPATTSDGLEGLLLAALEYLKRGSLLA
jgi:hypothetical protein